MTTGKNDPPAPAGPGLFISLFGRSDILRRLLVSVLVGLVSGLGALAFFVALEWGRWFFMGYLAGAPAPTPAGEHLVELAVTTPYRPWMLLLVPVLGGLLSGFLVYTFAPEAEGHGMDAMINAFHNLKGFIRTRVPYVKSLASIITLSTGGSAGREGPIAQIGAGFGSWLARKLKLSAREQRIFLLAGCAAGLGAIFRAPLGAAITSVEVLYREDFESEAIIPCVIGSVVAYTLFTFVFGFDPIFATPRFVFRDPRELIAYALLGLICAPVGGFYVRVFYGVRDRFRLLTIPKHLRPALGGIGVGLIGLLVPQALGGGYGYLQLAIDGHMAVWLMLVAAAAKIATTSLTIGSGGSGGVFGPTLFIGGMLGGAVGYVGHAFFPEVVHQPGAYVLVGMGAFFAGAAKAPLGALLMVSEMTLSYGLLPPLMLVSVIAILFNRFDGIYERQLLNKFQSPAHEHELTMDVLSELTVASVLKPGQEVVSLEPGLRFSDLQHIIARTGQALYPVLDDDGRHVGNLSLKDIRQVMFEDSLSDLVVVGELCGPPVSLRPEHDLNHALLTFLDAGYGQMPVVEEKDGRSEVLGLLRHEDVIAAYQHEVLRHRLED